MSILLKGKNINLRKLKKSDAESLYLNANDYDIAKFTTLPHPYKLEHALSFIKSTHRKIRKKSAFELGIEFKKTGKVIGMASLSNIHPTDRNAELGYWLGKNFWRRGLMSEAVSLILSFGFNELKLVRIYAKVLNKNIASANLLKKFGFKYEGTMRKATVRDNTWSDLLLFSILDTEFKAQ